jgi:hypothetical protein
MISSRRSRLRLLLLTDSVESRELQQSSQRFLEASETTATLKLKVSKAKRKRSKASTSSESTVTCTSFQSMGSSWILFQSEHFLLLLLLDETDNLRVRREGGGYLPSRFATRPPRSTPRPAWNQRSINEQQAALNLASLAAREFQSDDLSQVINTLIVSFELRVS